MIKQTSDINIAPEIHRLLLEAFSPYREQYTEGAFNATVASAENLKKRIQSGYFEVLVALCEDEIAGTVSVKKINDKTLYMATMAVKPAYYGKGIGYKILEEVKRIAILKECSEISLETSAPLTNAIALYERFGFVRTENKSDYHGITIFEMVKKL